MDELIKQMESALGRAAVLTGEDAKEKAHSRWSRLGAPIAVIRPSSTEEVAAALRLAHEARRAVTPWGGLTGLVDGAYAEGAIALSLERMNRIEDVDCESATMTVEAGCKLQTACEAAEAKGLFLPLDLGSRGSATIGGNISTNAGGNRVLRWGMVRESVLGLEAVLSDGRIISSLNALIKNNAGYDLKQLFIGTEGTLGVVTRAVLRLRPQPLSQNTAFVAVDRFEQLPAFLNHTTAALSGSLSAFEVMWSDCYDLFTTPPAAGRPPLPRGHPFYVLIETLGSNQNEDRARFEQVLEQALEADLIVNAVIAKSKAERNAMWAIRDDVGQTARNGPIFAFDVSLRIGDMADYVDGVRETLSKAWGNAASLIVFGHMGDGNLHLIAGVGSRSPEARRAVETAVYEPLSRLRGSISAEHGIGLQKRDFLGLSRSEGEISLMRQLKAALDPRNILNPGKVFETT